MLGDSCMELVAYGIAITWNMLRHFLLVPEAAPVRPFGREQALQGRRSPAPTRHDTRAGCWQAVHDLSFSRDAS